MIHTAAYFRIAGPQKLYFQVNVVGTKALLEAARRAGATTFVHVSAAGIIMDDEGSPIRDADESAPTFPNSFSGYIASKARAEAAVLAANQAGFRTIAIRPPAIWGPGDAFSRAIPEAIGSGQFRFIDRGDYPFATCHVANVIEAFQCALASEAARLPYVAAATLPQANTAQPRLRRRPTRQEHRSASGHPERPASYPPVM